MLGLGGYASGPYHADGAGPRRSGGGARTKCKARACESSGGTFRCVGASRVRGGRRHTFAAQRQEFSGIPIRKEFFNLPARTHRAPFTVLVTGGSQGSRRINQAVLAAASTWQAAPAATKTWADERRLSSVRLLHQTGQKEFEEVRAAYQDIGQSTRRFHHFFDDMPRGIRGSRRRGLPRGCVSSC